MRWIVLLCVVGLAAGCGEDGKKVSDPGDGSSGSGGDSSGGSTADGPAPDAPLSKSECGEMLDHIVDVAHNEKKQKLKPDEIPTEEQIAEIKKTQRKEMTQTCLTLPRQAYRCAMASKTTADLAACQEP